MTIFESVLVILSCFTGFLIGFSMCVGVIFPVVFEVVKKAYEKVYDKAVNDTLERIYGSNKKDK